MTVYSVHYGAAKPIWNRACEQARMTLRVTESHEKRAAPGINDLALFFDGADELIRRSNN